MINGFWPTFSILFAAAVVGCLAILPYSLRLFKGSINKHKPLKLPLPALLALSFAQSAILAAITIAIGLLAAHSIGLGAPYITAALIGQMLPGSAVLNLARSVELGVLGGLILLLLDISYLPHWPKSLLDTALKTSVWENVTASFYGGINEETLTRLFGVSVIAWLLARVWHNPAGLPATMVFWASILIMAVLFALGHLPALKNQIGRISPLMLGRTLLLNTPIGVICGWLFWQYGIEAAIVAHFAADIVYHVGGTLVLKQINWRRNYETNL